MPGLRPDPRRRRAPAHPGCRSGLLKQCTEGPVPNTAGPTQECIDSFNAFADSGVCATGASLSKCCAAVAGLGSCLGDIEAAMEKEPEKYANTLAAM